MDLTTAFHTQSIRDRQVLRFGAFHELADKEHDRSACVATSILACHVSKAGLLYYDASKRGDPTKSLVRDAA